MANFAELDDNNIVLRVIRVHDNECLDENGQEVEALGIAFCQNLFGGNWIQTSVNGRIRKRLAGIGFTYHPDKDIFISEKLFPSWILNEETTEWEPPVPHPDADTSYVWDEGLLGWVLPSNTTE